MAMQSLCHERSTKLAVFVGCLCCCVGARGDTSPHDYPTHARVEYVQECMLRHGGQLAALHHCSCVIDAIAKRLAYDEYVEATTFSRNARLGGDGGGIFRDSEHAKRMTKLYRSIEAEAQSSCGLK